MAVSLSFCQRVGGVLVARTAALLRGGKVGFWGFGALGPRDALSLLGFLLGSAQGNRRRWFEALRVPAPETWPGKSSLGWWLKSQPHAIIFNSDPGFPVSENYFSKRHCFHPIFSSACITTLCAVGGAAYISYVPHYFEDLSYSGDWCGPNCSKAAGGREAQGLERLCLPVCLRTSEQRRLTVRGSHALAWALSQRQTPPWRQERLSVLIRHSKVPEKLNPKIRAGVVLFAFIPFYHSEICGEYHSEIHSMRSQNIPQDIPVESVNSRFYLYKL